MTRQALNNTVLESKRRAKCFGLYRQLLRQQSLQARVTSMYSAQTGLVSTCGRNETTMCRLCRSQSFQNFAAKLALSHNICVTMYMHIAAIVSATQDMSICIDFDTLSEVTL